MKNQFIRNFLYCGLLGWCWECFWTGISSAFEKKEKTLLCRTSLWMFPIYGLGACMAPICSKIKNRHIALRGIIYTVCIFITEFMSGSLLKKYKICPWDYSKAKLNFKGVIRLDYAPAWFLLSMILEKFVINNGFAHTRINK